MLGDDPKRQTTSLDGIESARLNLRPSVKTWGNPLPFLAIALTAGASQVFASSQPWLTSLSNRNRLSLAQLLVDLKGSVTILPKAQTGQLWMWSIPASLVLIALTIALKHRIARVVPAVAAIVVVLLPTIQTINGASLDVSLAVKLSALVFTIAALAAIVFKAPKTSTRLAVSGLLLAASIGIAVTQRQPKSLTELGRNTPEEAAMAMVSAAQKRDPLEGITVLTPTERNGSVKFAQTVKRYEIVLNQVRDALGLTGEPNEVSIKQTEQKGDITIVTLSPKISGAGSLIVSLLGGLPLATENVDGRWYVSAAKTVRLIKG
jgi:hypothetical protein